ncbi:MAG: DUF3592 domain-containing protein [Bacteroidota bacterium]
MSTSKASSLVGVLVFLSLGLTGLGIGVWGLAQVASDRDWMPVEARVQKVESGPYTFTGRRSGGGTYEATGTRIKVWYAYEVEGRGYTGSRYSRFERWDDYTQSGMAPVNERLRALKSGTVRVWVDPDDPESAVLARAEHVPAIAVTVAALLLIGIGVGLLIRRRRRQV